MREPPPLTNLLHARAASAQRQGHVRGEPNKNARQKIKLAIALCSSPRTTEPRAKKRIAEAHRKSLDVAPETTGGVILPHDLEHILSGKRGRCERTCSELAGRQMGWRGAGDLKSKNRRSKKRTQKEGSTPRQKIEESTQAALPVRKVSSTAVLQRPLRHNQTSGRRGALHPASFQTGQCHLG